MEEVKENTKIELQSQDKPGQEHQMNPAPVYDDERVKGTGKLDGKVAIITGADSGIGRAVATLFAKEGADVAIVYYNEHKDAEQVRRDVEKYNKKCLLISGDLKQESFSSSIVDQVMQQFGKIDILVNNAGTQTESEGLEQISTQQLLDTFATNIFSFFWLTKACLSHMNIGSAIVNSTSVTVYRGKKNLIDYSSTKGAILAFTRSLASNLVDKGIRVNAVAPGPIWTPLIPASFKPSEVAEHGSKAPMERAGQPVEVAPCYLFLACNDSSYMTGQVLHPNGGEIVNG